MIRSTEATDLAGACCPLTLAVSVLLLIVLGPLASGSSAGNPAGGSVGYNVTVGKSGVGSGKVVSSPAGIDCGSTCQAGFRLGSSVELSARADAGSRFVGWTGACTGSGACVVDPPSDGLAASVGAEFEKVPAAKPTIRLLGKPTVRSLRVRIGCGGPDACRLQLSVQLVQAGEVTMTCCKPTYDVEANKKLSLGAGGTAPADEAAMVVNLQAGAPGRTLRAQLQRHRRIPSALLVVRVRNTATGLSSGMAINRKGIPGGSGKPPKGTN